MAERMPFRGARLMLWEIPTPNQSWPACHCCKPLAETRSISRDAKSESFYHLLFDIGHRLGVGAPLDGVLLVVHKGEPVHLLAVDGVEDSISRDAKSESFYHLLF